MTSKTKSIFVGIVATLLLFGCTSKEVKKAKEFMDASMYEQAISLLEIEIQDNPKNAEASFLLGKCYLETSNQNKVEECFKRAILLDTEFKENIGNLYFDKSLELYKEDNNQYASAYYEQGLKYNPTYKDNFADQLFDYTSEFSETTTESNKPIQLFSIIDNISPNYKTKISEKTFSLAKSFIDKGFVDEGFKYADFGIKYDPKHIKDVANLYFNYANDLLTVQNKPKKCFPYFERCIVLNPEKKIEISNIYYNQAKIFETNNEINLLLVFAKKSVEINPDYKSWQLELKGKYKSEVSIDGLVAYFPFNGDANDKSDNSNHGTVNGPILTTDENGSANKAYYFENVSDEIYIPHSSSFEFGTGDFSIEAVFKTDGTPSIGSKGSVMVLCNKYNMSNIGFSLNVLTNDHANSGKIYWAFGGANYLMSNKAVTDNNWHHLVVKRYDQNKLAIYIDGELDSEKKISIKKINNAIEFKIGHDTRNIVNNTFHGSLSKIALYSKSLSQSEINSILMK